MKTAIMVCFVAGAALSLARPAPATVAEINGTIAYDLGVHEEFPSVIYGIEPDGSRHRRLVGPTPLYRGGAAGGRWSRDGTKLLFARYRGRGEDVTRDLWYSNPSGRDITRVPLRVGFAGFYGYTWAPGGNRIVFAVTRAGSRRGPVIYTVRLDGTQRRRLGPGEWPSWSPDGRHIAFVRRNEREATSRIFVVEPDGRGLKRITNSENDSSPSFSPDGQRVLFARAVASLRGDQWRMVDVSGRHDRLVIAHRPPTPDWRDAQRSYCPPQWTPDGKRLAAVRADEPASDVPDNPSLTRLVTVTPAGRDERVMFTFPHALIGGYGLCAFSWQAR